MLRLDDYLNDLSTINEIVAITFLEELYRVGVRAFLSAPGSRNAPFSIALSRLEKIHSDIKVIVHFDERSLGFLALGISKNSKVPPVIIVTSGTAVANIFPAVIEAYQSNLGIIIISADRPFDLLNCSADQSIDQIRIFSNYAIYQDVPSNLNLNQLKALITSVNSSICSKDNKTIHFNVHFSEPLYPQNTQSSSGNESSNADILSFLYKNWINKSDAYLSYSLDESINNVDYKNIVYEDANISKKVLVVLGKLSISATHGIYRLLQNLNIPILVDILNPLRMDLERKNVIHHSSLMLKSIENKKLFEQADTIIQVGGYIVSKDINNFLSSVACINRYWLSEGYRRIDYHHNSGVFLGGVDFSKIKKFPILGSMENSYFDVEWLNSIADINAKMTNYIKDYFIYSNQYISDAISESHIIAKVTHIIDTQDSSSSKFIGFIFCGNSLPIRFMDIVALPSKNKVDLFTNRGANGIDGLLSTFLGISVFRKERGVLFIGDISFLHDISALSLLKYCTKAQIIIVFNNNGGAIFDYLPVAENTSLNDTKEKFFKTCHNYTFEHICQMFDVAYHKIDNTDECDRVLKEVYSLQEHSLIEVEIPEDISTNTLKDFYKSIF